jgi:hypothetical protein
MSKFSVGDRVVVVDNLEEVDRRGEVTRVDAHPEWPIEVKFDGGSLALGLCREAELEFEYVYDGLPSSVVKVDKRPDAVAHPSHYTWLPNGIEVIDVTAAFPFVRGNALKYLMRADHKGRKLEDLKKARWYLDYEIQQLEKESGNADS